MSFFDSHLARGKALRKWLPYLLIFGNFLVLIGLFSASISAFRLLVTLFEIETINPMHHIYSLFDVALYKPFDKALEALSIHKIPHPIKDIFLLYTPFVGAVWRADRTLGWRKFDPEFNVEDDADFDRNVALLMNGLYKGPDVALSWLPLIPTRLKLSLLSWLGQSLAYKFTNHLMSFIVYFVLSITILI